MVERIDLGIEYLGGITKPTSDDVGKLAVVRLDSLSRPNLSYETQTAAVADNTFASTLAQHLRGTGLTVDGNSNLAPRPRPRRLQLSDHFFGGGLTSGGIGALGWNLLGAGTPAYSRTSGATAAIARGSIDTTNVANDRTSMLLGTAENLTLISAAELDLLQCVMSPGSGAALNTKRIFFGLSSNFATEPSTMANGLGIYYDSAVGPNWQIIARASSSGSPVDSGVAATGTQLVWMQQATPGTWVFYVGNTAIGSISSGIPTGGLGVGWRVETLAATARSCGVGYFGMSGNIAGVFDDDAALEA